MLRGPYQEAEAKLVDNWDRIGLLYISLDIQIFKMRGTCLLWLGPSELEGPSKQQMSPSSHLVKSCLRTVWSARSTSCRQFALLACLLSAVQFSVISNLGESLNTVTSLVSASLLPRVVNCRQGKAQI